MPNPENLIGKGFESRPENINKKGRPEKIYTILKKNGYSKDDIVIAFKELAWYNIEDLEEVHNNKENPVIIKIIANQLFLALKKGDWTRIKEIMEHIIGKPLQKSDITSDGKQINPEKTTIEFINAKKDKNE